MRYRNGAEVRLGDHVEYRFAGLPFAARVVFVAAAHVAADGYEWMLDQCETGIGLEFVDKDAVTRLFCPANPGSVMPMLHTDVGGDEMVLVRRTSKAPAGA